MLPASANDAQDFGIFDGGMSVEYAIFKDAYTEIAKEFGILPRELQSITWEAEEILNVRAKGLRQTEGILE